MRVTGAVSRAPQSNCVLCALECPVLVEMKPWRLVVLCRQDISPALPVCSCTQPWARSQGLGEAQNKGNKETRGGRHLRRARWPAAGGAPRQLCVPVLHVFSVSIICIIRWIVKLWNVSVGVSQVRGLRNCFENIWIHYFSGAKSLINFFFFCFIWINSGNRMWSALFIRTSIMDLSPTSTVHVKRNHWIIVCLKSHIWATLNPAPLYKWERKIGIKVLLGSKDSVVPVLWHSKQSCCLGLLQIRVLIRI